MTVFGFAAHRRLIHAQALMPMALMFMAVSPTSGTVARRHGSRLATAGGVGVIALGWLTLGTFADAAFVVPAAIGLALTGLGMGSQGRPSGALPKKIPGEGIAGPSGM